METLHRFMSANEEKIYEAAEELNEKIRAGRSMSTAACLRRDERK